VDEKPDFERGVKKKEARGRLKIHFFLGV